MDPSSIITNVLRQLGNLAVSKAKELMSVRDQVMAWKPELELIQGKLEDLEFKPDKGKEAETWMCQLREVASKMSQVIDAYNSEIENTKPKGFRKLKFWEKPLQLNALSAEITSIKQSLETLHKYDLNNMMNRRPHNLTEVDDPDIVGFDSAKRQIIGHLLDKSISKRTVQSIVGIGGLGKTTLAKKVYNSYDLKGHFDCRAWQDISQTFDQYNILRKILYMIEPQMEEIKPPLNDAQLASEVRRCLSDKRYLIILDDVWSKDLWDSLKTALPDSDKGSRVIITTREVDVARAADRTNVCQLGFLTEDESAALLFRTALQRPDIQLQNYPPNLKDIAQKLIKKCGGLPLALIVLGGILSTEEDDTPAAWNRVYETMDWHDGDGQKCMKTLEKSYQALPNDHLKQCFRSLGDFPEDYDFSAELITRVWVAEELIPTPIVGTLDDQAEKCLQELVKRCLVQVTKKSTVDSYCKSFRVHDLLRDLAIRKTREEKLPPYRVVQQYGSLRNDDDLDSRNTHSLLCFGVDMSDFNFQGFEDLRVLLFQNVKWKNIDMSSLENWLEGLVHLRYLGFRDCPVGEKFLWNVSFGRLNCLETLDCSSTEVTPNPSLWGIPTLRHVIGDEIDIESNKDSPINWSCLKNLQILKNACFGDSHIPTVECNLNLRTLKITILNDKDETCTVEEWKRLKTLLSRAGYLVSLSLGAYMLSFLDVSTRGLPCYEKIQSLSLSGIWTSVPSVEMFPKYLTKLKLQISSIEVDPMSILEKLQSLRILCLLVGSYMGTKMVCSAGGFPSLQKLLLEDLPELREWEIEERAMPHLGHLKIINCFELRQLPELQNVKGLQELEVENASDELYERLETEDQYKIEHIPSVCVTEDWNVILRKVP